MSEELRGGDQRQPRNVCSYLNSGDGASLCQDGQWPCNLSQKQRAPSLTSAEQENGFYHPFSSQFPLCKWQQHDSAWGVIKKYLNAGVGISRKICDLRGEKHEIWPSQPRSLVLLLSTPDFQFPVPSFSSPSGAPAWSPKNQCLLLVDIPPLWWEPWVNHQTLVGLVFLSELGGQLSFSNWLAGFCLEGWEVRTALYFSCYEIISVCKQFF